MQDNLKILLKNKGYSLTGSRKLVLGLLLESEPQSLGQLVAKSQGKIDRASVYRTIALFEQLGIVHRINTGWKYKFELSDTFIGHHHHMHCSQCGKIVNLPANTMLETMIHATAAKSGFAPRAHQLEVYGLCPSCQKSGRASLR